MPILINAAGATAADPVVKGLHVDLVFVPQSMDIEEIEDAFVDPATGFPGVNSVKGSLHPNAAVIEKGVSASYDDATDRLTIGSTANLAQGDWIYLSHATIPDGIYRIASVVNATQVTLDADPFAGGGNESSIIYQVAWAWDSPTSVSPWLSDVAGDQNFVKVGMNDGVNTTEVEDYTWVRDADARLVELNNGGDNSNTGETVGSNGPIALAVCSNWANNGGVTHVELTNHSVHGVNDFWWDALLSEQGEKTLAAVEATGFWVTPGDGPKYSRLIMRSEAGGGSTLTLDLDVTLDTSAPVVTILMKAS